MGDMEPTTENLRRLVERHGAELQEDTGLRNMRNFQATAAKGFVWCSNSSKHLPISWVKGSSVNARAENARSFILAEDSLQWGVRAETAEEAELNAED